MSERKIKLVNNEFYHIFNRGVDKRKIFTNSQEISRFFQGMIEFNTIDPIGSLYENSFRKKGNELGSGAAKPKKQDKLVEFIAYCLNPNHYHFILKQIAERGIERFIHKLSTGYTGYFNLKHKRSGVLFQGPFKAVHIDSNEQLLHTSVYVNLNFEVHRLGGEAAKYLSSWDEYVSKSKFNFCSKGDILGQFKNKADYKRFAERILPSILERKEILRELEE